MFFRNKKEGKLLDAFLVYVLFGQQNGPLTDKELRNIENEKLQDRIYFHNESYAPEQILRNLFLRSKIIKSVLLDEGFHLHGSKFNKHEFPNPTELQTNNKDHYPTWETIYFSLSVGMEPVLSSGLSKEFKPNFHASVAYGTSSKYSHGPVEKFPDKIKARIFESLFAFRNEYSAIVFLVDKNKELGGLASRYAREHYPKWNLPIKLGGIICYSKQGIKKIEEAQEELASRKS